MKLDIIKAYDEVNWLYLRLMLIQLGMELLTIEWIIGCITLASFLVVINGSPSSFFNASKGFRQYCPLSLFAFGD